MTRHDDQLVENIPPLAKKQSDVPIGVLGEQSDSTAKSSLTSHALTAGNMVASFDTNQKLVTRLSGLRDAESIDSNGRLKSFEPCADLCELDQADSKQPSAG
ncbi:hypothetical protein BGZ65_002170, partial [Modicella reniformis]